MKSLNRFLVIVLFINAALGANILGFFPFPMKSHQNVFRPVVEKLAENGHTVTYVSPIPLKKPNPNIIEVIIPDFLPTILNRVNLNNFGKFIAPYASATFYDIGLTLGENVFQDKKVQNLIHSNDSYDVIFSSSFFVQEPVSAFAHKFNALAVDIMPLGDSCWVNEYSGIPDNPSYMIDFKADLTDDLDFLSRVRNTWRLWSTTLTSYYFMNKMQGLVDLYFNYTGWETRPSLFQLQADKALILINSHHSIGFAYPKAPHVKEIGGVHIVEDKPLPQNLEKYLNEATDGAIYVSMGTNVNISKPESKYILDAFLNTFKNLKQKVLLKWDGYVLPKVSSNVYVSKWFPQQDLLGHKNVKLFITHGGFLSISESIYHGVPLIGVPFFADQPKNMRRVETAGFGIKLAIDNITENSVTWSVKEILNNPMYAKEAKRRSLLFRDRPMKPAEEATYWIEYVIKHKKALQPRSIYLSFWQLHLFDILLFLSCIIFISFKIVSKVFGRRQPQILNKKKTN